MGLPESTVGVTSLPEYVATHLEVLNPLISDNLVNEKLMVEIPQVIENLHQTNATVFFETEFIDAKQITFHLGPDNIVRNGITFGLQTANDNHLLVRLYLPAGIESEFAREEIRYFLKNGLSGPSWFSQRKELSSSAIADEPTRNTRYFSSAEILVRTIAHLATAKKSFAQPLPAVLTDGQGQSVGYTLGFDRLPTQSKNAELKIIDTFFDMEETYGLAESSREIAIKLYEQLKEFNCLPYAESEKDLKNMLLLDDLGEFLTFNRIGYATSQIWTANS